MDVLTQKLVNTRKPHTCFGCGRQFPAGAKMEFSTIADGDTVYNAYLCLTCLDVEYRIHSEYGYFEFGFGELQEDALLLEAKRMKKAEG